MKPLKQEELSEAISLVQSAKDRDDLISIANNQLVRVFGFDFAAIYKKMGLGNRFTRMAFHSESELWGDRSIPDSLQIETPFISPVLTSKHPAEGLVNDPFAKGTCLLANADSSQNWVVYGFRKKAFTDSNNPQQQLSIWTTVLTMKWDLFQVNETAAMESPGEYGLNDLRDKIDRLTHANEELRQFSYRASHDLQEPLRTVSNYIGLFMRNYGDDLNEEGSEYLHFAKDAAERMHKMVKDLLVYTKLDHQNDPRVRIDGNRLLEEALANIKMAAEENDAIVLYEDMPELEGYEKQLVSLFQNLIDNAIKFKGDGQPVVTIDVNEKKKSWEFRVTDNGIGIGEDFKDKIFNFFTKLHSASEYKGSGLGLSICKKIVENHNGQIKVDSEEGKGTTFIFELQR